MSFDINQRFQFLNQLTGLVVDGIMPSLIVTGEGGLGKTHTVMQVIDEKGLYPFEYTVFKGYSTARGLYNSLYDNNGKVIIFDDCDSILEDRVALNILKSALDSYERRTISWQSRMSRNDEYTHQFDFTGRIIFISNKSMSSIDDAILSRSLTVDLGMTKEEKIERMRFILPGVLPDYDLEIKQMAIDFLDSRKEVVNLNLRSLIITSKLIAAYPKDWKNLADYMISTK
jgi:hypothetical protein